MTKDMTNGSPVRSILAFCVPLLIGNMFQQLYNLADSILVGRILGVNAFAAVGSTGALNFLIMGFALGICSGFTIPIAQSFGAGDEDEVRRRTGQLIWLGLLFSALITLIAAVWTGDILRITQTPEEIYDEAYRYIRIVFLGASATILYNLGSGVLRAMGDSRTPLFFLMGAVSVNVVLDVVFMKLIGMGVEGAAYATVLSQALSGLACLVYIRRRVPMLRLNRDDVRPDPRRMRIIASIGVPMGLQFSITAVGSIMVQSAVNGLGTAAVAAVSAGSKVHMLVSAPLESCGVAMATYCGQNLGAKKLQRIRSGVNAVVVMTFLYSAAAFVFNFYLGNAVAAFFIDSAETSILADVHRYLSINGAAYPMLSVIFIFRNSLQGMGFSSQAMGAGLAELVARAIVAFGLVGRFGFAAVCFANPVAWLFADALLLALYHVELRRLDKAWTAEAHAHDRRESLVSVRLRSI
ncbi:MAG: MATE family efflux transporter [Ruminococcaceae bacterium]|nr:MATE family efflux transporter [Oscillospiraceae bacterium]